MIKSITKSDLPVCIEVFRHGYESVAIEFGLTEDNCPDRGRASLSFEKLVSEFDSGVMMFGYFLEGQIVGFLGIKMSGDGVCKLNDIIVMPEYRQNGFGKELLNFCKGKAIELGATKMTLGMIDGNIRLKNWYKENGFINIGLKKFDKATFTVGYMECTL